MLNTTKLTKIFGATAIAIALTACGNAQTNDIQIESTQAPVAAVLSEAQVISQGTFSGRSDHVTTGQVVIEKTANGYQLRLGADFFLDGAPDPVVALGNGETFLVANNLGALQNKTGAQTYQLPADFSPRQFSQAYIWCEKFSVPLGVADLS